MAKVANGRVHFIGTTDQTNAGEFVSGRQLLDLHVNPVRPSQQQDLGGRGGSRDFSVAIDRSLTSASDSPGSETALAVFNGHGHSDRGYAPMTRTLDIDPRIAQLEARFCGTHEDAGKGFNGYDLRAEDRRGDTGDNARVFQDPSSTHDEGVLNVAVGGTVSGLIDVTGDTDTITVTLVAGQTYSFHLYGSGLTPVTDTFLELYAPDGTTLINDDDDGANGTYSLLTFTAAVDGTYNLVASSFDNPGDPGVGNWTLAVHQQGADEAPSAPPSAVPATLGMNYGFITPAGTDEDVYSINLTAGTIYSFQVAAGADYETNFNSVPLGEVDTIIRIYNSAGTLVATNDDIVFDTPPDFSDISSLVYFVPEVGGTYYVEVDGYAGQTGGYVLEIAEADLDPLDAINWGGDANVVPGNEDTLLIYFATEGQTFDGVTDLGGWTPYLQAQALAAFQTYSEFSDLTFAITTNQAEADFTMVTTESDQFLAYFNPPGETNAGVGVFAVNGTGWDETGTAVSNSGSMEPGGYGWITLIHEIGHGLGLAHPHDNGGGSDVLLGVDGAFGSYGLFDLNQGIYTTMSYNDGWQLHPDVDGNGFPVPDTLDYGYQGTPMAFDIALIQIKYGAVANETGDNVYTLLDANVAGTFYQTIWDTGGTDEIEYVGTRDATIDLTAATLDYSPTGAGVLSWVDGIFGGYTIAATVVIENATTGEGDDILVGNSAANILTGNGGNDSFVGKEGNDEIFGGDGSDTVVFLGNQADYTVTDMGGGTYTVTDNNTTGLDEGTDTVHDVTNLQFADGTLTLGDLPGNQAPTLTGFGPTVVFNENTVNSGPQLLDADVTFTDTDNNFDGGTLVVSGLLAEDVVAIRNQGNLPGQVGVSGANLSYGGVVIGTIAGGNGATLTVTFNAQATATSVEAVIENLTYANADHTPTLNRTLTINVTDDEGASLIGENYTPGPYVEQTGANDPLANPARLATLDANPTLAFVDVNNDGDLDIIAGTGPGATGGTLRYFENNGAGYTEVTGAANPFNGFDVDAPGLPPPDNEGAYSSPATIDLDGDGDLDLVVGSNYGYFFTFQNNGNGTWTQLTGTANPFDGLYHPYFSDVAGIDFDGDGDMDLVSGNNGGGLAIVENEGGGVWTPLASGSPFPADVGSFASPTAGDIDGDGDDDLVVGLGGSANPSGQILTFRNDGGGTFTPLTGVNNPFNGIDVGSYALPVLVDLDGDGDADFVVGDFSGGDTRVWMNTGVFTPVPAPTIQVTVHAQNDAPAGTSGSETILENTTYTFVEADFGFTDALDNNAFLGVVITTLPTNGALTLNNVAVTAGQFVTLADITGGLLVFTPDSEENGDPYASFTFQVRDDGGTANGGLNTDQTPNTFTFTVTPDNFAPELTDLDSPVTFLESVVNTTPQLLDTDVTLTDDNGFANGSVVVSGLLAEDRVSVNNEGTGAGQIGVSGTDVTYEGVVIGSIAGGVGNDLTITLNAAATTAGVEALLENLTYANVSDAPTASRTLSIQVYDDEGLGLPTGIGFSELTGGDNPFDGFVIDPDNAGGAGNGSIPTFVDVNGDGDLDLVVGGQGATLQYLENDGAGNFTEVTGAADPFDTFDAGPTATYSAPAAVDVDGDGDLDLVVGSNYGDLIVLENDGVGGWTDGGILAGVSVYAFSTPTAVDLDGDGLGDLVLGSLTGFLYGFINNGDGTFTELVGANDPFLTTVVPYFSAPGFVDIDGDGDMDAVVGDYYGGLTVFTNDGGDFVEAVDQPFAGETFASIPAPTFVDIDNDGDMDMVLGSFDGDLRLFENLGASNEIVVNVTAEDDVPVAQPDSFSIDENQTLSGSLFANNGSGPDTDPDGPPLTVSAVNGSGANVGFPIALASGALLIVNANGTFAYNPNGSFLPTPTAGSGASNTPAQDSFTYTLAGGNTVTVTITLNGVDTNDLLLGTAGADMLIGGTGNDTYRVENASDQVIELSGQGYDVVLTTVSYALAAGTDVEWLSTTNTAGTEALNLTGNEISQVLVGNNGANTLNGNGGADVMVGFAGDDIYVVDDAADLASENAGGGFDAVLTGVSYALAADTDVEWLSTTDTAGTDAINLTGNGIANYLIGNNGANTLDGGGGADVMVGFDGNDIYIVDNAADLVFENDGEGFDALLASASYSLAAGQSVEWLSTTNTAGTDALNLTGNEVGQYLLGNNGANTLDGGAGHDVLIGFGGADTFAFTSDLGEDNLDLIVDFEGGSDKIALDDAIFTALGGLGTLDANAFVVGTAAADASDRIIYDAATGQLFYDADGNGAGAQVLFASLQGAPALTANDFVVI